MEPQSLSTAAMQTPDGATPPTTAEDATHGVQETTTASARKEFLPVDWPVLTRAQKPEMGKRCYRIYRDTKEFVDVAARNVLDALHASAVSVPFKVMTPFCGKEIIVAQKELLAL